MSIFTPNKTSAKLLVNYASQKWGPNANDTSQEAERRFLMTYDLYIKARSYAIINKVGFWLAIMAGIAVLFWPSLAVVTKDFGFEKEFLKSAIVQTTVTAIAALTFSMYSHYKKRQTSVENLMRHVVYSDDSGEPLVEKFLKEIERIYGGFSFSETIAKDRKAEREE